MLTAEEKWWFSLTSRFSLTGLGRIKLFSFIYLTQPVPETTVLVLALTRITRNQFSSLCSLLSDFEEDQTGLDASSELDRNATKGE